MDSHDQKSPWDALLENLGAQPAPDAFQSHQPPASELPSAAAAADKKKHVEPPTSARSDWGALAGELGLEVFKPDAAGWDNSESETAGSTAVGSETVRPKPAVSKSVRSTPADSKSPKPTAKGLRSDKVVEETSAAPPEQKLPDIKKTNADALKPQSKKTDKASKIDRAMEEQLQEEESIEAPAAEAEAAKKKGFGISGDAARSAFDALFSAGAAAWGSAIRGESPFSKEPRELTFSDELDATAEEPFADGESTGEDENAPKKRKRPRRPRGGRGRRPARENVPSDEPSDSLDAESVDDADLAGKSSASDEAAESDDEKPRRRRPRRRSNSRGSAEGTGSQKPDGKSDDSRADDKEQFLDTRLGDEDDSDDEDQVGEDGSSRTSHRNLPTWSDAIGILVDSNLVLHSKSPGRSSSSRGQGGRGRGGRGRSGPKKS